MAFPTTLALITALWSGNDRTRAIALWSAIGGAIASLGPLLSGALLEQFDWGSVFLVTLPLASLALYHGLALRPRPRQRGDRAGRQPRRHPLDRCWWRRWCWGSTSRRCLARARWRSASASSRSPRPAPSCIRQRRARSPLYDLDVADAADLLGRRLRRDHRLRLADGGDVHRPAVPPERARLLDPRLGPGDPAGGGPDGDRRAALGEAGRVPRRPLHPAARLRLLPARLPHHAAALEGGHRLLEGRRSATPSSGSASASPAPRPRTR